MGRLFVVNSGLVIPVALIVLCLAASIMSRCAVYLLAKFRCFFITISERLLTSLGGIQAQGVKGGGGR